MLRSRLSRWMLVLATISVAVHDSPAQCSPPNGYYASIDASSPARLRATLHARIQNHSRVAWNGTWAVLERADEDPQNSSRILDIYRNASYPKFGSGNSYYNREHSWPKSLGFPVSTNSNYPESDCHALFLTDSTFNSARANKVFRNLERTAQEYPTLGGGSGTYPGNSCWTDGFGVTGAWETWKGRRGEIARALFYLDVRYDGSRHQNGSAEPDLILTDDMAKIVASQSQTNLSIAHMGLLSVLLAWHQEDPPDARECHRNDAVYAAQGNRNPFIDHPEWVALLYRSAGQDLRHPWINEFHYDNAGGDVGEMVEIAGPSGLDLTGYRLVAYNGSGGGTYDSQFLVGTIPVSTGCIGARSFDFAGLQNGPSDGIALVDPTNRVLEFVSYEGVVTAIDGPAVGMTSRDVGVSESSATPIGHSIQLGGSGMLSSDFTWRVPTTATPNAVNAQQTFVGGCGEVTLYGCGLNPYRSIALVDGIPTLGASFTIAIDNPLATQSVGSPSVLALSPSALASYPCGLALPSFGMRAPGASGEFLLDPLGLTVLGGPLWNGIPATLTLPVPNDVSLSGAALYLQAAIIDPLASKGILIGLTDAARVRLAQ
ncbi:MAG: endonuclease [Planctomycetes bacterium]|nr:endonuclease [Planctomycetota bacterium]